MTRCSNCQNFLAQDEEPLETCDQTLCVACFYMVIQNPCLSCHAPSGVRCNTNNNKQKVAQP